MAYKKIYIAKKNHIVIASGSHVTQIRSFLIPNLSDGEGSEIPSTATFIRRLRLYQEIKFTTTQNNFYEVIEMLNERYSRRKM